MSDINALMAAIVPICGNCRFHLIDEHGGGWNKCDLLERRDEASTRYKYSVPHTCDVQDDYGQRGFQPDYFHIDGIIETLKAKTESGS